MQFRRAAVDGAYVLTPEILGDDRGWFARVGCVDEFALKGITSSYAQENLSHNPRKGTLRGMHGEMPPTTESKRVRCTSGAIFDVVLDVRPDSPTRYAWFGVELSRSNRLEVYVPPGCLHGFLTLTDDVDVLYHMGSVFRPGSGIGVRWNDPFFGIDWPFDPVLMSDRDRNYPDYVHETGIVSRRPDPENVVP
jgi:dTDP-4-dehydrorhamnose 3,5-epimerase